jgi:HEAT repeat protein
MQNSKYLQNISHSQVLELVEKEDIESLTSVVKTSGNPGVLKHAILFLGEHKVKKAVDPLILLLLSEYESVRQFSALALGQIGEKKAIKPLSLLLNQEKEIEFVRKEVLRSLVVLDGEEGKESIYQILTSEWSGTALTELKEMGKPSVKYLIDALLQAQQNGDQVLMGKIISILGEIGECAKPATATLLTILKTISNEDDWDCSRRQAVLISLALIKNHDAVEPLIGFINYNTTHGDGDYAFQIWLIFALGDIGDKQATEALIHLVVYNGDSRLRGTAAAALGKIGDDKAIEPLLTVLENEREDEFVRENAAWALLQLDENKSALPVVKYLNRFHKCIFDSLNTVGSFSETLNDASE